MTDLFWAWLGLAVLSAATTAVAISGFPAPWAGGLILLFAWAKARLILVWYLGLVDVPTWRQGLLFVMVIYLLVIFALYVAA